MKLEIDYTPPDLKINHNFTFGENFDEMLKAGIEYAKNGTRGEARYLLTRVTDADPDNETAWLWLASISEYPEELLVFLKNVLRINPENQRAIEWTKATRSLIANTFLQRGIDAVQDNRREFAERCFTQALSYDDQNESAWLWLASSSESPEEKKAHFERVLEINPQNETALASVKSLKHQLAQALLQKANFAAISGEREEASRLLDEAMQDAAEFEETWILKAYLAADPEEKISYYEKVLQLNPENETAQAGLASLKDSLEKSSEQKSNAQMLRDVLEASGSEILYAGTASQTAVATPDTIACEEIARQAEAFEKTEAAESGKFIPEAFVIDDSTFESSDNPTDELNPDFVKAVSATGAFDDYSFGESIPPADADLPVEIIEENSDEPVFGAFEQENESLEASEPDEVLQFVQAAEARVFHQQEPEPVAFEEFSGEQELDEDDSFLLPDVSDDAEFGQEMETLPQIDISEDDFPPVEDFQPQDDFQSPEEPRAQEDFQPAESVGSFSSSEDFSPTDSLPANFSEVPSAIEVERFQSTGETVAVFEAATAAQPARVESADENAPESAAGKHLSQAEPFACSFCFAMNEPHTIVCPSCRTMLSLSDMEAQLAYADADSRVLEMAIEDRETEKAARQLSVSELTALGVAYLNLKNLRKALQCLQEASHLAPNDVVLASKANFLAIRLAEIEDQESRSEGAATKILTVMVVDDSPTVRKLISGKLEKCGHTVVTAADGAEALVKIQEVVPDLILLDIMMPQMDGYQVCKLIRSNEPTKDVPVVMISGKDGFFDKVRGRMAGTTGFITKPFGPETLMRAIETYVL